VAYCITIFYPQTNMIFSVILSQATIDQTVVLPPKLRPYGGTEMCVLLLLLQITVSLHLTGWHSGNNVEHINKVALHQFQLLPGGVTIFGCTNHLSINQPLRGQLMFNIILCLTFTILCHH